LWCPAVHQLPVRLPVQHPHTSSSHLQRHQAGSKSSAAGIRLPDVAVASVALKPAASGRKPVCSQLLQERAADHPNSRVVAQ
jgi:hypothetical protein